MCYDAINTKCLYVDLSAIIAITLKMIYGFNDKPTIFNYKIDIT